MEQFKAPSPLSLTSNPSDNWHSWEQSFRTYIAASGEKDDKAKIDILLRTIGKDALEVYNTLTLRGEGDELTMEDVLQVFKDHCSPQKNVVVQRVQYWSHQRTAGTSINRFITELQQKSKDCEFGIIEDDMLRDKLVLSITDSQLKKRLLQERRLTFYRAIEICRATELEKTPVQAIKTEHGVPEVPVDAEMKNILPDKSLHHNPSRKLGSQSVPNTDHTKKLVLAAFMPRVHLHRIQLQQPSDTGCVFSERKNVEQLLPERLHIKEEPEMLSEGQEENQLCVQQKTNSAACPIKCEDEEEKPEDSQLHWRQLTEINMKEEPSTYCLNELMTRQSVGINSKGPEAAQNPDSSSLVLPGPDGTETDSSHTEDTKVHEDDDEDCWQEPLSESEVEADFHSPRKKRKMSDSSKNPEMGHKASQTQICSKKLFQVKMTSECVGGNNASVSAASKLGIHTGEKPSECDVWRKCFTPKPTLQQHMSIYTAEKPFKCGVCQKCFTYKSVLLEHMRIHREEKTKILEQGITLPPPAPCTSFLLPPPVQKRTTMPIPPQQQPFVFSLPTNISSQTTCQPHLPTFPLLLPSGQLTQLPPLTFLLPSGQLTQPFVEPTQPSVIPRSTKYYRKKKREREEAGQVFKKYIRTKEKMSCRQCGKERTRETHKQYYGNWFCQETSDVSYEEWRNQFADKMYGKKTRSFI